MPQTSDEMTLTNSFFSYLLSATHLFLEKTIVSVHDRTLFRSSNIHSIKLNYAHNLAFTLPFDLHPQRGGSENDLLCDLFGRTSPNRFVFGENLLKFVLQPQKQAGLDDSLSRELADMSIFKQVKTNLSLDTNLNEQLNEARTNSSQHSGTVTQEDKNKHFPWDRTAEIVFLGTVSSSSNPVRSESSIYLDIPGYGGILLDVG